MPRSEMMRTARLFYAGMFLSAVLWSYLAGRPLLWRGAAPSVLDVAHALLLGVIIGLGVVALTELALDRFTWARELGEWFEAMLGPLSWSEAIQLALLSGIAEEALFRGAMMPTLGLWPSALLFALVHVPPTRRLVGWTIMAFLIGLGFGLIADHMGHVFVPIAAHFTINAVNLKRLSTR